MQSLITLRVLMVLPKYPNPVEGGLERQAYELSRILVNEPGVKVHVLSTRFDPSHKKHDVVEGVSVTRVIWSDSQWFRFVVLPLQVAQIIWKLRKATDVVHIHQHSPFGLFAIAISRLFGLPVLVKLPNFGEYGIPGMRKSLIGRLSARIFLRANAFISMSDVSFNELMEVGVLRSKILTIPNGIVPSQPRFTGQVPPAVKTASLCRVVFVGRIFPEKRLDVLLHAWQSIIDQIRDIAILEIWGDGPLRSEFEQWCRDRSLSDLIIWRGHVADVRIKLADADVFVLPSSNEGNSNAILEAMDAAVSVIATPVGGTAMQLGRAGASHLVPVGDADALAKQMLILINDPQLRHNYGSALRLRTREYFDLTQIAKGYLCAYRKLMMTSDSNLADCARLPPL